MIQRIQSLLLLCSILVVLLHTFLPVWTSEGVGYSIETGLFSTKAIPALTLMKSREITTNYGIGASVSAIGIIALLAILVFNNRGLQMRLCQLLLALHSAYFYFCFSHSKTLEKDLLSNSTSGGFTWIFYMMILSLGCVFAAWYYIRKDDDLIKSVDRIR